MERKPYHLENLFFGNRELFNEVLQNPKTVFVFDNDGIFSDTSKIVYKNFSDKYGKIVKPDETSCWAYLTDVARKAGFDDDVVRHAEDDFYNPDVFKNAQPILYIKPVIQKTLAFYGPERNYILTARNPEFKDITVSWFKDKFPEVKPENILIREKGSRIDGEKFKIGKLKELALKAPWIVFVDDALQFVQAAVEADIPNCLIINVPQGVTKLDFSHKHLIVIKRFPDALQAMYPLMDAINRAISKC